MYLVGQLCGIAATIVTVFQPHFRTKTQISLCCIWINALNGLNFAFLGQANSAFALCIVAVVQACLSVLHEKSDRHISGRESGVFSFLYIGAGLLGLFVGDVGRITLPDFLPTLGALMLMLSICARSEQKTRFFLLLDSLVWLVYTAFLGSTVFFSSLVSLLSSAIALWKYYKR